MHRRLKKEKQIRRKERGGEAEKTVATLDTREA